MKNKKKNKFWGNKGKNAPVDKGIIEEFLYMIPSEVTVRDFEAVLTNLPEDKKEIWVELDMMEVILQNDSLVFENMMDTFDAESDQAFLSNNGIKKVYAFNYNTKDKEAVADVLKELHTAFGGFVASDTENFEPMCEVRKFFTSNSCMGE